MALSEKRTQIYLPLQMFGALKKEARAEKKPIAQVVREAIANYLEERRNRKIDWENDPMTKMIGAGSMVSDASINHDHYLYGYPKKKKE
jgi:hypothetical protein